jgi:hypothetical protein
MEGARLLLREGLTRRESVALLARTTRMRKRQLTSPPMGDPRSALGVSSSTGGSSREDDVHDGGKDDDRARDYVGRSFAPSQPDSIVPQAVDRVASREDALARGRVTAPQARRPDDVLALRNRFS